MCLKLYAKIPCPICSKLVIKSNITHHRKTHTALKHSCTKCKKTFKNQAGLDKNTLKHGDERKNVCEFCGKIFLRPNHLKKHKETHEITEKAACAKPRCKFCDFVYTSKAKLKVHLLRKHLDKARKCEKCQKPFFSSRGMRAHMKVHSTEKPGQANNNLNEATKGSEQQNNRVEIEIEDEIEQREAVEIEQCGEVEIEQGGEVEIAQLGAVDVEQSGTVDTEENVIVDIEQDVENAIFCNLTVENIGNMGEVIADGVYSIGNMNLTGADIEQFVINI